MAQGLIVVLGTILIELSRALNFIRNWLGSSVMPVTRRGHQQLDPSSMESVIDRDTHPSELVF